MMNSTSQRVQAVCHDACAIIAQVLTHYPATLTLRETGLVQSVRPGIARVTGLPGVRADELVCFPKAGAEASGEPLLGIAFNLDPEEVGVILLGDSQHLQAGDEVYRTERVVDVPVGDALLGRVVTVMGAASGRTRCPRYRGAPPCGAGGSGHPRSRPCHGAAANGPEGG